MPRTPKKIFTQEQFDIQSLKDSMTRIESGITDIKTKLEEEYVTRLEFAPVRAVTYGMVSLLLAGVVGAMLALLFQ